MLFYYFIVPFFAVLTFVEWYAGIPAEYATIIAILFAWGFTIFDWHVSRSKDRAAGYEDALQDLQTRLSNASKNDGGIDAGNGVFIKGAHWSYEIHDQIEYLRELQQLRHDW